MSPHTKRATHTHTLALEPSKRRATQRLRDACTQKDSQTHTYAMDGTHSDRGPRSDGRASQTRRPARARASAHGPARPCSDMLWVCARGQLYARTQKIDGGENGPQGQRARGQKVWGRFRPRSRASVGTRIEPRLRRLPPHRRCGRRSRATKVSGLEGAAAGGDETRAPPPLATHRPAGNHAAFIARGRDVVVRGA